jgi:hypothetical protein
VHLKKGTAAGPFGDLPDTVKAFALYQPPPLHHVLELILNNQVPSPITSLLAASHFMALHKDPADHTKLRPISMGSALRRVAGKYFMELYGPTFAKFLLPQGQFGIALKGGLQLMVDTARTQLHRYIDTPQPTRALLLLDMANMFNCVSRRPCKIHSKSTPNSKRVSPSLTSSTLSPTNATSAMTPGSLAASPNKRE